MKILILLLTMCAICGGIASIHTTPAIPPGSTPDEASMSTNDNTLMLPLEVMGPDGTVESTTLNVKNATEVKRLYLKTHSISYPEFMEYSINKASMRLNNGKWVDIDNKVAACFYPESMYECVVSPYATIRFWVQVDALGRLKEGVNQLDFRFNYQSGDISSGYRILEIDVLYDDGSSAINGMQLQYDDPRAWAPITTDPDRLENGRRLYETRGILSDYPGGPKIRASCQDCHTKGGRDLKYFNYSDHSIISRSVFHGFTEKEGEDIASWVRAYELTDKEGKVYDAPGTPWDPPYQPGPGLDDRPVHEWAAGAGLEWALDHDSTSFRYLVEQGQDLNAIINIDSTLNRRELPIALQLPDWNEWLPVVHPLDTWGAAFENSRLWTDYNNMFEDRLLNKDVVEKLVEDRKIDRIITAYFKNVKDYARHDGEANLPKEITRRQKGIAILGLYQWDLVKTWEFMHENHLEDITDHLYPQGEVRGWFSDARTIFNLAPHIHGASKGYRGDITNTYYDTAWYELQVIINSGNRETVSLKPVDWKYHFSHIGDWKKASGVSHGTRYIAAYIKVIQNGNNRHGVKMPDGFYLRHTTLAWVHELGMPDGGKNVLYEFDEIRPYLKRDLAQAFTGEMLKKLNRHDYNEWDRTVGKSGIEPPNYIPSYPRSKKKRKSLFDRTTYADHFYRIIPIYYELGVDPVLLNELALWGRGAWPQGDWDSLMYSE